ncbi:hypothetical protein [Spiroplasma endosymbiont of Danaus chrysippus]|uniref:hypothetical protein n=1 Tax=Spiroplasma endosymbiont of Danaus chrysippus TaxID=2691041 RepID=UPI00157AF22B|nr:hypothetical protein [Spiroplasma endosymbiont of Danaus chrysippus]
MINKLWTDVSLENYNNWYPLTGKITETPQQYIQTWPIVNDWFKTFAIRAQNDINAYLDFILSKFPFDSFKDELIKETLRDMVYVMVEHWVFNRTPIEFNVDATIQFNNGNQFSANSTPTINVWDLAPSRMKIWARLTELKQIFSSYNNDEIDVEKIDLKAFYTRNQVDELIKEQKEFTLLKQIKLYDDLVDDNENEIYRGPVSKFINKGYVATDYDKETETMILDWPDEIGTLPPEALQNNPQIGDYTHAPTCDFSAKQQKRITTNENEITKLNSELTKTNENIDDIKNNWFNIETSPLWKKVENNNIETFKWYFIKISYQYSTENNFMKFYKVIKIYLNNVFNEFELLNVDSMTYSEQIQNKRILNTGTIYYNNKKKEFSGGGNSYPERGKINLIGDIKEIYQYQGIDTPTEFIAEESTERDYYTKIETNNLLDKKQNKLIAGENITIDKETNTISATGGSSESLWEVDPNSPNIIQPKEKRIITSNNTRIVDIGEPEQEKDATTKQYVDNLLDKKQDKEKWLIVATSVINGVNQTITYDCKENKRYRIWFNYGIRRQTLILSDIYIYEEFIYSKGSNTELTFDINHSQPYLICNRTNTPIFTWLAGNTRNGNLWKLEELEENNENIYKITSNTLNIISPNKINMNKPIKIISNNLETNEIEENCWDIELKNNPIPSIPKWKEVGTREKNKWDNWQITYDFKENKHYRVYYSWSIYNPVYTIQEFIITDKKIAGVQIQTFNDSANIVILSVQHAKLITIYTGKGNLKGNVWKLEELQE